MAVRSLFLNWDTALLVNIYAPFIKTSKPDFEVCSDYRRLLWNGRANRIKYSDNSESNINRDLKKWIYRLASIRFIQKWGTPFRYLFLSLPRYARGLQSELNKIKPDIVYSLVSSMPLAKAVTIACKNLRIPLFIHIVDDYVNAFRNGKAKNTLISTTSEYWQKRLIEQATGCATISPYMANEYSMRYGGKWTWFTTLVNANTYDPTPKLYQDKEPIRLVYAGVLGFKRWETLRKLGIALQKLRDDGMNARLIIYAPPDQLEVYKEKLKIPSIVEIQNWVPMDELPEIFQKSDILVHVETFKDKEIIQGIKWSLSTKISQYMMAGRCILALGPTNISSIRFIKENKVGIAFGNVKVDSLAKLLRMVFEDKELIINIGKRARCLALEMFEEKSQRERFRQLIELTIKEFREGKEIITENNEIRGSQT